MTELNQMLNVTQRAPGVHRACTAALQHVLFSCGLILAIMFPVNASALDLRMPMNGCLASVEAGSIDGFSDLNFTPGPNGTYLGDLPFGEKALRVVFADIEKPPVVMCTIFGHGDTANDVLIRWGQVDDSTGAWHAALLERDGWEDITMRAGVGYGAMNCSRGARAVVVTSQPVWQMFKPLGTTGTRKTPRNAAFQFEARASTLIDCDVTRARAKQSREG